MHLCAVFLTRFILGSPSSDVLCQPLLYRGQFLAKFKPAHPRWLTYARTHGHIQALGGKEGEQGLIGTASQ
ncbi:hypothetical protein GYMLUDRAFT_68047 [Collybiopsis luxurians FD-317 M1]|nr:hypothetical protein GYMLUDRAFT_68047 [Collybiopsis luxurians FD-317 M1]